MLRNVTVRSKIWESPKIDYCFRRETFLYAVRFGNKLKTITVCEI